MIRFSYEQKPPRHRRYLWSLALFVAILLIFYVSLDRFSADSTRRQKENLENIRGNLMSQRQPTPRQQYRIAELDHELSDIVFCLYKYFS